MLQDMATWKDPLPQELKSVTGTIQHTKLSIAIAHDSAHSKVYTSLDTQVERAIPQAVIRRPLIPEALAQYKATSEFWWTKQHWDRFLGFSLSVSLHQCPTFTHCIHRRYIILAADRAVKKHLKNRKGLRKLDTFSLVYVRTSSKWTIKLQKGCHADWPRTQNEG
jgi:hypothetical protein